MAVGPTARAETQPQQNPSSGDTVTIARGVIIKTAGLSGLARAQSMVDAMPLGLEVERTKALGRSTDVLMFDEPVSAAAAQGIATALEARSDVVWAVPDLRVQIAASPAIPNDPYFPQMTDMWDGGGSSDYSVKAPLVWGAQKGSPSVVVAVIDTGVAQHPDLDANLVPGYDFVSEIPVANDGDGWDDNPSDPGDWITSGEASTAYWEGCKVANSSWHGTHVTGTVAAIQDNSLGITGVAPGVRVQPVRALGKCGGYDSDVVAAITWASGGAIPGVPANPTPASVINMSLGGDGLCTSAYAEAVSGAIARGTTVVAAAGNEDEPMTSKVPANCSGVISVTATDASGQRASYSNYGVLPGQATIAAPGGDLGDGVLSTYNAGTKGPVFPASASDYIYRELKGTSMATPHVAGAAALLYSAGVSAPASVRAALVSAVQPFAVVGGLMSEWDCTTLKCGAGILDLSRLPVTPSATAPGAPTGLSASPTSTTTATLSWTAPADDGGAGITGYRIEESLDSGDWRVVGPAGGDTTSTDVIGLTPGASYQFRVAAVNEVGTGAYSSPSAPIVMPTKLVTVPGKVSGFTRGTFTQTRTTYRVTVRWKAPADTGGAPITGYRARVGLSGNYTAWTGLDRALALLTALKRDKRYTLQVRAVNSAGRGPLASYSFTTPSR